MSFLKLRDLIRAKQAKEGTREPWRDITIAKVFEKDGSIYHGAAYVWVNLWGPDGAPAVAFNPGFTLAAGDWVKVGSSPKQPYRWSILDYWAGDVDPEHLGRIARHNVGLHGWNHQWPTEAGVGADPVRVYQPAMQQLKTTGNGTDLTIAVQSCVYNTSGVRRIFNGTTIDLTSSVPTAGETRAVLIYLNMVTNFVEILEGTSITIGIMPPPHPYLPTNGRFSAYVILIGGQTSIDTATDIEDARDFLASDTDFLPTPTAEGQVMVADDTLQGVWVTPMIDENGYWMSGDDDQLVWE